MSVPELGQTWTPRDHREAKLATAREALEEIARGEGAYSRDPFEHACNTIDAMKDRARATLAALDAEPQP